MKIKKLLYLILLVTILNCDVIRVGSQRMCKFEYRDKVFLQVFKVCMSGQRSKTHYDDADDFVEECRETAIGEARKQYDCTNEIFYCYDEDIFTGYKSGYLFSCKTIMMPCKNAETEDEKKACAWYGYRKEKK